MFGILAWIGKLGRYRRSRSEGRELLACAVDLARREHAQAPATLGCSHPVISFVVPVFDTPTRYLDDLLRSFYAETERSPAACELILSDDGSRRSQTKNWLRRHAGDRHVKVVSAPANQGIAAATNRGIAAAVGTWIGLLDHDDALAPYAVDQILRTIARHPDCRFIYTDEIIADADLRPDGCFLKPAFDPVLLSGVNYINHLSLFRREPLLAIGGLRQGFEGSQDYDLVLRYTAGLTADQIRHLPYPAYLWRRDGRSYSKTHLEAATQNARRALNQHWGQAKVPMRVDPALSADLHRIQFRPDRQHWPHVSVIIPSREQPKLLRQVMQGLRETDYRPLDIVVVDNGSQSDEVLALYRDYQAANIPFQVDIKNEPFNFSRSINRGLRLATGEVLLLLNNDVEIQDPGWLKEMVSCLHFPDTGIVGARLLYPDRTLQHAGVIVGFGGLAGHWYVNEPEDCPGPMGRLRVRQSMSAVTGACLLITRACLDAVGPLEEQAFAIAYNDVDLCMRALKAGFRIVWTPFATLVHHESASRGSDVVPDKIERFHREQAALRKRHRTDTYEDPAINPWYTKDRANPQLRRLTRLPPAR